MNAFGFIALIVAWLFVDVYLVVKIKKIKNSDRNTGRKIALIGLNIILAAIVVFIALSV